MRRFLLAVLFLCAIAAKAQTGCTPGGGVSCTPNLNLWVLPQHYQLWGTPWDENATAIDTFSISALVKAPTATQEVTGFPLILDFGLENTPNVNNVFYGQASDTLASIEAACVTVCTYIVTQPQTLTLTVNHTLSSNVKLVFTANGLWNVIGSFVLTLPGDIQGTLNKHFAGNSPIQFGMYQPFVPVEWFGAVADGNQTGGGTDNTNAINFCLGALSKGQCVLQTGNYKISAPLIINHSGVGIIGKQSSLPSQTLYPTPSPSEIITSSPSADVVDVFGSSNSNTIAFNRFENFTLARSAPPGGGLARGLSMIFVDGPYVSGVTSEDSIAGFYIHGMASQGEGVIERSVALWGANGVIETTGGSMGGFILDSSNHVTNNSARFVQDGTFSALPHSVAAAYTTYGFSLQGDQTHDAFVDKFESATTDFGLLISQNSVQGISGSSDIHFTNMINDSCFVTCLKIGAVQGSVEITGGWEATSVFATNTPVIEIDGSNSVSVNHVDIYASAGTAGTPAVKVDSSTLTRMLGNNITVLGTSAESGMAFTSDTGGVVHGNTVYLGGTGSTNGIFYGTGTSGMAVGGNSVQGTATNGILVDSSSNGMTGLGDNTIGDPVYGTIVNFLVNNGSNPIILWGPGAPTNPCNNPGELWMNSSTIATTFPLYTCKGTVWLGLGTAY